MSEHHIPVKHERSRRQEVDTHTKEHLAKTEAGRAEKAAEHATSGKHEAVDAARHEVHEQAVSGAEYEQPKTEHSQPTPHYTRKDKEHSFNTTMHHVRRQLSRSERQFSKFIHQPVVEKTSEVLGKTVARPSGVIGGTVAAFVGLLSVYSIARFAGFQLSGSEMPLLLGVGFIVGLLTEWVYKAGKSIVGKRS